MSQLKILIADDHSIVRKGISQIISETENMEVVFEAENGNQVLEALDNQEVHVVVLDINMPEKNGLETLKEIKEKRPSLPVLILSMYEEDLYAIRVLKAGGSGYLTKASAPKELVQAIEKVANGGKYISPDLAETLALNLERNDEGAPHEKLSDREMQVFLLIGSGKTVSEIAKMLKVSVTTVSTHRSRILEKMDLENNAQLTHYAMKRGLVG
jgi:DNA-binding NarL/FixJ family response regulator